MPRLLELSNSHGPLARQSIAIYEASFPADERHPTVYFEGLLEAGAAGRPQDGRIWHFYAAVEGRTVSGLSIYEYYRAARLGYLFYMAVNPERRGRGMGSWLFQQTLERLGQDARLLHGPPPLGMFWEVERPEDAMGEAERTMRARRIEFYRRNGGLLLEGIDFVAPPVGPGLPEVPFFVMYRAVDGKPKRVSNDLARRIVEAMLLEGYQVDRSSAYYHRALASLSEYRSDQAGTGL